MSFLSAPYNFLVQRSQNLGSKDLGLWDLGMKNDRKHAMFTPQLLPTKTCSAGQGGGGATDLRLKIGRRCILRCQEEIASLERRASSASISHSHASKVMSETIKEL